MGFPKESGKLQQRIHSGSEPHANVIPLPLRILHIWHMGIGLCGSIPGKICVSRVVSLIWFARLPTVFEK
jgi:hypothetical protein